MWENLVCNDPDDDYNLVIELWYNNINRGIVKWNRVEEKYDFIVYPSSNEFIISCDMLQGIIDELVNLKETRKV